MMSGKTHATTNIRAYGQRIMKGEKTKKGLIYRNVEQSLTQRLLTVSKVRLSGASGSRGMPPSSVKRVKERVNE